MRDHIKCQASAKRIGIALFVMVLLAFWCGVIVGAADGKEVGAHIKDSLAACSKVSLVSGI